MRFVKTARRLLLPPWVRFLNKSLRSYRKLNSVVQEQCLPRLDFNPLRHKKSSDTLFILGSGSSVLTYTSEEWKTIADHDSLGFNYWILHPFVPTHYIFELTKYDWDLACITKNLVARTDLASKSCIYLKDAERFDKSAINDAIGALPGHIKKAIHLVWDAEIPGDTLQDFTRSVISLSRAGGFTGRRHWAIPKKRATLFFAINLAVRAGYKNIVLCGVDLNNTNYFFRADEFLAPPNLCIPPEYQSGPIHKTNNPAHGEATISAILDIFDRLVLQPRDIALSVAKETSALYPRFKAYFASPE